MTVIDLFAGAGGMTQGFHLAKNFRTVRAVESDPASAATFAANFGEVVHVGTVSDWLSRASIPQVDVVVGGPPCQGFSMLGTQNPHDPRNSLWRDFVDTVVGAGPKYFVLENVPAFLRSAQFQAFTSTTSAVGPLRDYAITSSVLNAADYGAAQLRKRTIVIGHHRDLPAPGLPAATHRREHITLRSVLSNVPRIVRGTSLPGQLTEVGAHTMPGTFSTEELHVGRSYTPVMAARIKSVPRGGGRRDIPADLLPACWGGDYRGSSDVMGRLSWDRPSVTIRTAFHQPEKGRYLHPSENRTITHLEAALIQGFPFSHRWVGSKAAIARQIGNAVPIPLAIAIADHLKQHLV
jgi:DNA (cytosine-5)-methyltransferase 1